MYVQGCTCRTCISDFTIPAQYSAWSIGLVGIRVYVYMYVVRQIGGFQTSYVYSLLMRANKLETAAVQGSLVV